jgi:hypothetical protein
LMWKNSKNRVPSFSIFSSMSTVGKSSRFPNSSNPIHLFVLTPFLKNRSAGKMRTFSLFTKKGH